MPRYMEVALCGIGLLFLLPLLLLVALLVKLTSPGPVLFRQWRVGLHGRPFLLLKFRSMRRWSRGQGGTLLTSWGDKRITSLGAFLRYTKLDELPQLWNVVCGDMALVGPRPEVPYYVRNYPHFFHLVLQQRPGITDVCTLHLRREEYLLAMVDDPESYYVETLLPRKLGASIREGWRRTFWRDLRVLVATVLPPLAFLAPAADFRPLAALFTLPAGAPLAAASVKGRRPMVRSAWRIATQHGLDGKVFMEQRAEQGG